MTHGLAVVRGLYDDPDDPGAINHFQALSAALSATIGLGNIGGVALAIGAGGPGALFWMWLTGILGMALKSIEITLSQMYRNIDDPDDPHGGAMWVVEKVIASRGGLWKIFGRAFAVFFCITLLISAFTGGNMFQSWNVADVTHEYFGIPQIATGIVLAIVVGMVIIGGIKRIGAVASRLVPFMCIVYVAGALYVILLHAGEVPKYLALIVRHAFSPTAESGACAGVSVWIAFSWGLKRACFSNEAGEGSAAMAHAAAKTEEPIREGVVAGIGPFIDTIIICTMSALVILMTGAWNRPAVGTVVEVDGHRVVVERGDQLREDIEPLYLDLIAKEGGKLRVHLARGVGQKFDDVAVDIASVQQGEGTGWNNVRTITMDLSAAAENDPEKAALVAVGQQVHLDISGAEMTGFAFDTVVPGFGKYIVTLGVCLFAFSTMISWSYYGEKGAEYLLGPQAILPYKFVFVIFVFLGMVLREFKWVYNFSDATTGLMVLCNLPAVLILSPVVLRATRDYFRRLDAGQMPRQS
jgi:AGCS family alanine or glycine:cation symporter